MTLRMKAVLGAASFSTACWAIVISVSIAYLNGTVDNNDHIVTASITIGSDP